jgi:putative membrane protein
MPESDTLARDRLAVVRTKLANERTLLAYLRTALMLIASGVTLWRFYPAGELDRAIGYGAIAAGLVVLAIGTARFYRTHGAVEQIHPD